MTEVIGSRMRLRSSVTNEERKQEQEKNKKEDISAYPFIKFRGKIKYCNEFIDCAIACDELINLADKAEDVLVLGFDAEWPFSFQTGSGKVALIQISPDLESCVLLQVSGLQKIPKALPVLLAHPKIRITGVNIKNDVRKLAADYPGFDSDRMANNCIDSGTLANKIFPFTQRWSMAKLVGYVLKMTIDKNDKVRKSKWNVTPLSKDQILYAATDAYASLLLYVELKKKETENVEILG